MKDFSFKFSACIIIPILLAVAFPNRICSQEKENIIPWCIVAYDSLERSPSERMEMLEKMGFVKYAYDWRDRHLDDMEEEMVLARNKGIEVVSVWLWLNAKRDSLGKLSSSNERIFNILEKVNLNTTLWVSFSNNFFEHLSQDQSEIKASEMIQFIYKKANKIGCKVALYNHRGWFGDPHNQVTLINKLSNYDLSIVYNFHHGRQDVHRFPQVVDAILPYLATVNLNGVRLNGPEILTIGDGDHEKEMIKILLEKGYKGPWGVLGHIAEEDVQEVLARNLIGFERITKNF